MKWSNKFSKHSVLFILVLVNFAGVVGWCNIGKQYGKRRRCRVNISSLIEFATFIRTFIIRFILSLLVPSDTYLGFFFYYFRFQFVFPVLWIPSSSVPMWWNERNNTQKKNRRWVASDVLSHKIKIWVWVPFFPISFSFGLRRQPPLSLRAKNQQFDWSQMEYLRVRRPPYL